MTTSATHLVLFDVDGTLIRAYGAGRHALEEAFALVFATEGIAAHLDAAWFAGKTDQFIFREVALRVGVTSGEFDRHYPDLEARYIDRLRAGMASHPDKQVLPGVVALLEALATGGAGGASRRSAANLLGDGLGAASPLCDGLVAVGLMTGNIEPGARAKLEPFGLNRFFASGGFGGDALERSGIGRVALDRFERLLGRSMAPESVFVVGDTLSDIEAARACGFRVLAVGTGWGESAPLRAASPDAYLEDLSDTDLALRALGL